MGRERKCRHEKNCRSGFLWIFLREIFACNHILAFAKGSDGPVFNATNRGSSVGDHIVKYAARLGGLEIDSPGFIRQSGAKSYGES